jgi:hypothetical protein
MSFRRRLHGLYLGYTVCFLLFLLGMGLLERWGVPHQYIGFIFLAAPLVIYAVVGVLGRTTDPSEYYVAGRRVPALYNGMAVGADWLSAASFIGLAGTLYLSGYGGLAFVMGWTGGFVLVALLLAPTCASSASSPFPISWAPATRASCRASSAGGHHPVLLRLRGGADLRRGPDHHPAHQHRLSRSASSWAWAGCWSAPSWAACGPSPGPRWPSTSC